jgi:hypothetical protein
MFVMNFKDINFTKSFTYSNVSYNIPLEFFDSVFPVAVEVRELSKDSSRSFPQIQQ